MAQPSSQAIVNPLLVTRLFQGMNPMRKLIVIVFATFSFGCQTQQTKWVQVSGSERYEAAHYACQYESEVRATASMRAEQQTYTNCSGYNHQQSGHLNFNCGPVVTPISAATELNIMANQLRNYKACMAARGWEQQVVERSKSYGSLKELESIPHRQPTEFGRMVTPDRMMTPEDLINQPLGK